MDEQTRRELKIAYGGLRDMDNGTVAPSLDAAVRYYSVARRAVQRYPTNSFVSKREGKMNGMLDRVVKNLTGVRSSIF